MQFFNQKLLIGLTVLTFLFTACEKNDLSENLLTETTNEGIIIQKEAIQNTYIVTLDAALFSDMLADEKLTYDERKEQVAAVAKNLLNELNVRNPQLGSVYGTAIQGFSVQLTIAEVEDLKKDERVIAIEQDQIMQVNPIKEENMVGSRAQSTPYGITRVNGGVGLTTNATAWIVDSGIDLDHEDLNVDVSRSKSFVHPTPFGFLTFTSPDDQNGHGTHCAGTVAAIDNNVGVIGVVPGATVVSVRVLDAVGSGFNSQVIEGVDYVAANAAAGDVANMSLGGGASSALDAAVQSAASSGILFSLAAGNDSEHSNNSSPGRTNGANIYTISAHDVNDNFASFSNFGNPPVDYCNPGVSVYSTYMNGGYSTLSGTSMAAPHFAGLLLMGSFSTDGTVNNDPDGNADPIAVYVE